MQRIELQQRDLALLLDLFESRLMTTAHVALLHFDGRREAAKKRLQRLKAAGLIGENPRRPYEPSILSLTPLGHKVLHDQGALAAYPPSLQAQSPQRMRVSPLTLRHESAVMDVKAALVSAIRASDNLGIAQFSTWPTLCEFAVNQRHGGRTIVKPDGFIQIVQTISAAKRIERDFFLEVDRSTESLKRIASKALLYREHYRNGGFALKHGFSRSDFAQCPFRVLMVFRNAERRNNATEQLLRLRPPLLSQVWLASFEQVVTDPLGEIWVRPIDYRAATENTPFKMSGRPPLAYRRQPQRDLFVEEKLLKQALFRSSLPIEQ